MLAMVTVTVDTAWAIFAKSTLQRAVRLAVRTGVTLTATQMAQGACLTDTVKKTVQANALGLLNGQSGYNLIKVNYFQPPAPNSNGPAVDVSGSPSGDAPGNIMQVSVQNFVLVPILPRFFDWKTAADKKSTIFANVNSADLIEPSRNPPCIGTAP
ncbi:MAG: hypothetical protein C5B51_11155 [Terriglobia bacterium]|nr:MAG: hypothetical protein C5B51_11155 [Terriglobia bacterium]